MAHNQITFYLAQNSNATSCTLTFSTTDYPSLLQAAQAIMARNGIGYFVDDNGVLHSTSQVVSAYLN